MTAFAIAIPSAPHEFKSADEVASELQLVQLLRASGFPNFAHRRLQTLVARAPASTAVAMMGALDERSTVDRWLSTEHGHAARTLVPSAMRGTDGLPRFVVAVPHPASATLIHCITSELSRDGADTELRNFLDEILIEQMAFIDFDPGVGFAALTAATAPVRATSVYAVCDATNEAVALQLSIDASNANKCVQIVHNVNRDATVDTVLLDVTHDTGEVVVHAGVASAVPRVLAGARASLRSGRVAAITWRCVSRVGDALMTDDEFSEQVESAIAALTTAGFANFALAERDDDVELVALAAVTGNTLVISLSPEYVARAGVA